MKQKILLVGFFWLFGFCASAQDGSVSFSSVDDDAYITQNFCGALMGMLADAENKFGRAKGKEIDTHGDVAIWSSNIGMPGVISSSLLFTTSWHYEGVVYLSTSEPEMGASYKKFRTLLETCMDGKGYVFSSEKNTERKLENYPAIVYTKHSDGDKDHVPHVSLEASYMEQTNTYTVMVNIWE